MIRTAVFVIALAMAMPAPASDEIIPPRLLTAICQKPGQALDQPCVCAIRSLVAKMGLRDFSMAVLGELPDGATREEAAALVARAPALMAAANAECGSNLPTS